MIKHHHFFETEIVSGIFFNSQLLDEFTRISLSDENVSNDEEIKIFDQVVKNVDNGIIKDYYVTGDLIDRLRINISYLLSIKTSHISREIRLREYINFDGGWHVDVGRGAYATMVVYLTDHQQGGGIEFFNKFNKAKILLNPARYSYVLHFNQRENKPLVNTFHRSVFAKYKKILIIPILF